MRITAREHMAALIAAGIAPHCPGESYAGNAIGPQVVARRAVLITDALLNELARVPAPYHCARRGCGRRIDEGRCYCDEHTPPQWAEMEEFRRKFAENMRLRHLAEQERAQAEAARPVQLTPEQEAIVAACETFMGGGAVAVSGGCVQGMTLDGQPVPPVEVREDDGHTD